MTVLAALVLVAAVLADRPSAGRGATPAGRPATHWQLVLRDDFNGSRLGPRWFAYNWAPGGGQGGWWSPSHVQVRNGELVLRSYADPAACGDARSCPQFDDIVSGGIQSTITQTYGKYLVRLRTTPVADIGFVALLWPTVSWPPEIDFGEEGGVSHLSTLGATVVYGSPSSPQTLQNDIRISASRWHTIGVEWSPGSVVYTLDGRVWGVRRGASVSAAPMRLALQVGTDCELPPGQACPVPFSAEEPDVEIDWVAIYARARGPKG